ncbi:MAG TPA: sulfite exporter TauE/SafE family protein [Actinophytocola sp.]|uniref:sulfite exporter TauE/SafE family protein n=1 Tax=Actinophytocola sp. TaxID=1872138 RepID=UPI002DBB5483|nr:sulfite exporter TauE/SafE family protein [Actinophytocola sp.]HEU5475231.1 sulfite exporter TauE/SafE family protein [Actinophytocola sp.]
MSTTLLVAGIALALGGLIQGVVGFGLALVATPVLALLEPGLLPAALLLVTMVHTGLAVLREHEHVDWTGVGWAMLGRLPGTVVGVLIVDSLPQRAFSVVVGTVVLAFTVLSVLSWRPRPTPRALTTAGLVSGAFGTAMAIGGPPVALLYQHESGARIRSTMSAFFLVGGLVSVLALAVTGHLDGDDAVSAALLAPFLLVGFALSGPARGLVTGGRIRYAVVGLAGLSALVLIGRSLLG